MVYKSYPSIEICKLRPQFKIYYERNNIIIKETFKEGKENFKGKESFNEKFYNIL